MTYTLFNGTNNATSTYIDLMVWANNTVEGAMGYGILIIIFFLVLLGTRRYEPDLAKNLFVSFLSCFMVGWSLVWIGILNTTILWLVGVAMLFSYIYIGHS